jgi:hypothetical protein
VCTTSLSDVTSKFHMVATFLMFLTTNTSSHIILLVFNIYLRTKFRMPNYDNLLIVTLKLKAKENIRTTSISLITSYKNIVLVKLYNFLNSPCFRLFQDLKININIAIFSPQLRIFASYFLWKGVNKKFRR